MKITSVSQLSGVESGSVLQLAIGEPVTYLGLEGDKIRFRRQVGKKNMIVTANAKAWVANKSPVLLAARRGGQSRART